MILYLLLIAHFIGDYYLQNRIIAKNKAISYKYTFLHCLIYALPFYLIWGLYQFDGRLSYSIHMCVIAHMMIDMLKVYCTQLQQKNKLMFFSDFRWIYLVDQFLHIFTIVISVMCVYENIYDMTSSTIMIPRLYVGLVMILLFAYQPYYVSWCILFEPHNYIFNTFEKEGIIEKLLIVVLGVLVWCFPIVTCLIMIESYCMKRFEFINKRGRIAFFVLLIMVFVVKRGG